MEGRKLYGAIDIGTNAGRVMIGYVIKKGRYARVRQVELTRVPLRLGADVFEKGYIGQKKQKVFIQTMVSFKHLFKAYGVKDYLCYATSAMREASNNEELIHKIYAKTKLNLELIDGMKEANLIFSTFFAQKMPENNDFLYIDVGGGSTEISFISNLQKIESLSLKLGTVRGIKGKNDPNAWKSLIEWIKRIGVQEKNIMGVGSGGNINRVAKILQKKYLEPIDIDEAKTVRNEIKKMSFDDRVDYLLLRPDRADVIVPALDIYLKIMREARIEQIMVPRMGLTDGMILKQYYDEMDYK